MSKLGIDFMPIRCEGLYQVEKDEFGYIYNPDGYGGIVVLDKKSMDIFNMFDGKNSLGNIANMADIECDELEENIKYLMRLDLVQTSEPNTRRMNSTVDCWLHTTNSCNLACTYCYIHKCPGNMSIETAKKTITTLMQYAKSIGSKVVNIRFAGGEPLSRKQFLKDVIAYVNEVKQNMIFTYMIISNGTLMDEETIEFIKQNKIGVGISLDGIGKYNCNRVYCDGRSSYEDVMKCIDMLLSENVRPRILITVCPSNLDGLAAMTRLLCRKGLDFRFSLQRDMESGKPDILNYQDKAINVINECFDIMEFEIKNGNTEFSFQLGDINYNRPKTRGCGAASNSIAVNHAGKVSTCGMNLLNTFGNVDNNIFDIMHEVYKPLLNSHCFDIDKCKVCTWRHCCANACPSQNYATYGRYDMVSPYCHIYESVIPHLIGVEAFKIWQKDIDK